MAKMKSTAARARNRHEEIQDSEEDDFYDSRSHVPSEAAQSPRDDGNPVNSHREANSPDPGARDQLAELEVEQEPTEPVKRKRGRPRMHPEAPPKVKGPRGRPRKTTVPPEQVDHMPSDEDATREPGQDPVPQTGTVLGSLRIGSHLSNAVEKDLKKLPGRLSVANEWAQEHKRRDDSLNSLEKVQRYLRRPGPNEYFSEEDQKSVHDKWRADGHRQLKLDVGGNKKILTLYKDCLWVLRCLPEDIICKRTYLEYDQVNNKTSMVWTAGFCELLKMLVCHPFWLNDMNLLVTAIQYVIITVSDDVHPWKYDTKASDSFPSRVQKLSRTGKPRSMRNVRLKAFNQMKTEGIPQSTWNLLFERIEDIANQPEFRNDRNLTDTGRTENAPYKVNSQHLTILTRALDSTGPTGWPMFPAAALVYTAVSHRRSGEAYPQEHDLRNLMTYAILRSMELDLEYENRTQTKFGETQRSSSRPATADAEARVEPSDKVVSKPQRLTRRSVAPSMQPATSAVSPNKQRLRFELALPSVINPQEYMIIHDDEEEDEYQAEDEDEEEEEEDVQAQERHPSQLYDKHHSSSASETDGPVEARHPRKRLRPSAETDVSPDAHGPPSNDTSVEVSATQSQLPSPGQQHATQSSSKGSQDQTVPETQRMPETANSEQQASGGQSDKNEGVLEVFYDDLTPEQLEIVHKLWETHNWKKEMEAKKLEWPAWLDESDTDEDVEFPKAGEKGGGTEGA